MSYLFFQRWLDPLKTIKKQCRGMYNNEHNMPKHYVFHANLHLC